MGKGIGSTGDMIGSVAKIDVGDIADTTTNLLRGSDNLADGAGAVRGAGNLADGTGAARATGNLAEGGAGQASRTKKALKFAKENPKTTFALAGGAITSATYGGLEIKRGLDQKQVEKKRKECKELCTEYDGANKDTEIFDENNIAEIEAFNSANIEYAKWDSKKEDIFINEDKYNDVRCYTEEDNEINETRTDGPHFVKDGDYVKDTCGDHCEGVCKKLIPDAKNPMKTAFKDPIQFLGDITGLSKLWDEYWVFIKGGFYIFLCILCFVIFYKVSQKS